MSETSPKLTLSIPASSHPPVALYRPLKFFGKSFKVHISTGLTLSPHTVLHSALDLSLMQLLRNYQHPPDERFKDRPEQVIKDLLRAMTGRNKLSTTTQDGVKRLFSRFIPDEALEAAVQGKPSPMPIPWQSDWEAVLQGLGGPGEGDISHLVQRLAQLDRLAWSARGLPESEIVAFLEPHIGRPQECWQKYNPRLSLAVAFLVDISLQTLVWMEWTNMPEHPLDRSKTPESRLLPFLAPEKKPLGHWLIRIQKSAGCANFAEFGSLMFRKGIKRHDFDLSHNLLKKWSSGQQLMPMKAAKSVLEAVKGRVDPERERGLFAVARFVSFLCDLIVAGTRDEPPTWAVAQGQIRGRYNDLYAAEAATRANQ